jgi:hypothetical protein
MGMLKGILTLVVLFVSINGGLWLYYKSTHGYEQEEYARLEVWLAETEAELSELEDEAESAESDEAYNLIVDEHTALVGEYDEGIDTYNEVIEVLNKEWYLIPIPLGKSGK